LSVKTGSLIWNGNGFVLDRVQNAGPSALNLARTRVYEDGNPQAVGIVSDQPDLTFDIESWDMSTDFEAINLGLDPAAVTSGQSLVLTDSVPLDVLSPWRRRNSATVTKGGIIIPALYLETAAYRYGVRQQAAETFTYKGDAEFWSPGAPYRQSFAKSGAGPYALAHTAIVYRETGVAQFVLGLCWIDPDGTYKRLFHGLDYTDTANSFTLTAAATAAMPGTATLHAMYSSLTQQTVPQQITKTTAEKPAAYQSKDIDVYISDGQPTPTMVRWDRVQTAEVTWKVTRQATEELGNPHYVEQDYDVPDVSGTITVRPSDIDNLLAKLAQALNVAAGEVVGVLSSTPLEMEVRVSHPDTKAPVKTHYIPDARFSPPTLQARANSSQDFPFPFQSEAGLHEVIKGAR
jgi:hypothetical protein